MNPVMVEFRGPYGWFPGAGVPFIGDAIHVPDFGLYLWTASLPSGYLVQYVGETGKSFSRRSKEHARKLLKGRYEVLDPTDFALGVRRPIWPGAFGKERRPVDECEVAAQTYADDIQAFMRSLRFFIAPIDCDERTRCRIEGAIARYLAAQPGIVGAFQSPGVRYSKRWKDEVPIPCEFRAEAPILGMPERLDV